MNYKVGWWKKGEQYRYCLGMGLDGLVYYRTKRQVLGNSRRITGRHPDFDKWFKKAEYMLVWNWRKHNETRNTTKRSRRSINY